MSKAHKTTKKTFRLQTSPQNCSSKIQLLHMRYFPHSFLAFNLLRISCASAAQADKDSRAVEGHIWQDYSTETSSILSSLSAFSSSSQSNLTSTTARGLQSSEPEPPRGTGCNFRHTDGTTIHFEEGASMGTFAMVSSCANNVPEAFPCYCVSDAPGQTVCPYCFFQDTFEQNICGRSDNTIGLLHPNRTFINCQCHVAVTPTAMSYQVDVSSNCDMLPPIKATYADPAAVDWSSITTVVPGPAVPDAIPAATPQPTPAPTQSDTTKMTFPPFNVINSDPPQIITTAFPIPEPTVVPSTNLPTRLPTKAPLAEIAPSTSVPSPGPTNPPVTATPTSMPTNPPMFPPMFPPVGTTIPPDTALPESPVTYQPGNLTRYSNGLWLSEGLSVKIIAQTGRPVSYHASTPFGAVQSDHTFHPRPDGAAIFNDTRTFNEGGWLYVSNSETKDGSVSAMTFNSKGEIIHYHRILTGSM